MLKKISFILAVVGITVLLILLILPGRKISDIDNMAINEKVILSGRIIDEGDYGDFKIWQMEGKDFDIICDCKESFLDKEVSIVGLVDDFNGEKQVRVLTARAV